MRKLAMIGRGMDAGLVGLLVLPFLLLLIDPRWLHTGIINRDGWIYHAYFIDLPGLLRLHPDDYYNSRLSILLPGWLLHRCLPPEAAILTLHLFVYYAIVLGLYWILSRTVGQRAALLASVVAGTQGFVLTGATSNYIDGFGPAYFLLATGCLAEAGVSRRRPWLVLAGMAIAALVVANILFVLLVPGLVAFAVVRDRWGKREGLVSGVAWVVVGSLALLAFLAIASKGLGGRYNFLHSSIAFARSGASNAFVALIKTPTRAWFPQAGYLVLPLAAAVGAGLWLLGLLRARSSEAARQDLATAACFQAQLLGMVALLALMQKSPSFLILQFWFYPIALLLPPALLALGAQWQPMLVGLSGRGFIGTVLLALALGLLAHGLVSDSRPLPIVWCVALASAGTALAVLGRGPVLAGLAVASLAVADWAVHCRFSSTDNNPPAALTAYRGLGVRAFDDHRREVTLGIDAAMRLMRQESANQRCWVWFDNEEPLVHLFDRISCLHACQTWLFQKPTPGTRWRGPNPPAGSRVAVLSARPWFHEEVAHELAVSGLATALTQHQHIGQGATSFYLTVLKTSPLPRQAARRSP